MAGGYDPNAARCEQIGGELANVWNWAIFDTAGNRLEHKTDAQIFLEDSTSAWGDGWASPWGISIWGNYNDGDIAYIKNSDGSKRNFVIEKFNGTLRNWDNWMAVKSSEFNSDPSFFCNLNALPERSLSQF